MRYSSLWVSVLVLVGACPCSGVVTHSTGGGDDDGPVCEGNAAPNANGECEPCPSMRIAVDGRCVCMPGTVDSGGECIPVPNSTGLGSDWHPDPDGDGIATPDDACPYVYDPVPSDRDGDGIGDACDPDATSPTLGGPIVDLRAEHVTPYGAWLMFTSTRTVTYYWDAAIAWSTNRDDLASAASIGAQIAAGQGFSLRGIASAGEPIVRPVVIRELQPNTTYFLTARPFNGNSISPEAGNIIEFRTEPAPLPALSSTHPRALSTAARLAALATRYRDGDASLRSWVNVMGPKVLGEVGSAGKTFSQAYCVSASLLFHITGEDRYRNAALLLTEAAATFWENTNLENNAYRWADARLGVCTDLMWDQLSESERNRYVAAFLVDDEANMVDIRLGDTDQAAGTSRTLLIDGLAGCDAPGLDPALSARACAVLDQGLRLFFGVQMVKARRDRGFFAQSGGNLPDGIEYAHGTSQYWLEGFHVMLNAGAPVQAYATWVLHNQYTLQTYALTPGRRGYATFGDLDSYDNFDVEPNSLPLSIVEGGRITHRMGLLDFAGRAHEAAQAKWYREMLYEPSNHWSSWTTLLFERDEIQPESYMNELPVAFLDSGMGMFYDRTSWSENASYFVLRAGWHGVDHSHEDIGNFQLYRRGRWITHEALGYGGTAGRARGHNVMMLETVDRKGVVRQGQFSHTGTGGDRIVHASSGAVHSYAACEMTGTYRTHDDRSYDYTAVQRQLLWLKSDEGAGSDRIVVYDLVDNAQGVTGRARLWQLHMDEAPQVSGRAAQALLPANPEPQRLEVDIALPTSATLTAFEPEGVPSRNPAEVYTHRLVADPNTDEPSLRMVSVIRTADESAAPAGAPSGIDEADEVGVVIAGAVVIFARAPMPTGVKPPVPGRRTANASATLPVDVWWTGFSPRTEISLTVDGGQGTLSLSAEAAGGGLSTDEGGVLSAHIAADGTITPIYR